VEVNLRPLRRYQQLCFVRKAPVFFVKTGSVYLFVRIRIEAEMSIDEVTEGDKVGKAVFRSHCPSGFTKKRG